MTTRIITGDCRDVLKTLESESVHCCVTSPPYFGLRDYGTAGQIGLEESPDAFVAQMVEVFREVRRILRADGTLWLNLGDSYANDGKHVKALHCSPIGRNKKYTGLKPKDMIGIPWRVAFALQADGWFLRQDIIWAKPNPMPESVTDRCTKAHEYLFLLSKSPRYYFDAAAIAEPLATSSVARLSQDVDAQVGSDRVPGKTNGPMKAVGGARKADDTPRNDGDRWNENAGRGFLPSEDGTRNKRSVWTVSTQAFKEAHFATFPPALIVPCVLAGSPAGGMVLDPFGGAGTTGMVADRLQRNSILIELNPEYASMARKRITADAPLLAAS